MRIDKGELTQERLVIIIAVAVIVIALAAYFIFYAPLLRNLRTRYLERSLCETAVFDTRSAIEFAGKAYEGRILPTDKNISQAIDELTKHGKLKGVNFIAINPKEPKEVRDSEYKILPIEMKIESAYEQLAVLLGSLDELDKSLVKVISFDIIPGEKEPAKFITNLTVNMYFLKEENAE